MFDMTHKHDKIRMRLFINTARLKDSITCCLCPPYESLRIGCVCFFCCFFLFSTLACCGQQITPIFFWPWADSGPSSSPHFLQLFKTVSLQNRHPMTAVGAFWGPAFQTNLRMFSHVSLCFVLTSLYLRCPFLCVCVCVYKACAIWPNAILKASQMFLAYHNYILHLLSAL